jgi:hypothetical protein
MYTDDELSQEDMFHITDNQENAVFHFVADEIGIKRIFAGVTMGRKENFGIPKCCILTVHIEVGAWPHKTEYVPVSVMRTFVEQIGADPQNTRILHEILNCYENKYNGLDQDMAGLLKEIESNIAL